MLLTGITLVPFAVAFVALFTGRRGRIAPYGDTAVLELSVREVGEHVLLLGPYSRYHWHHPGPLLFDWLAIPYRLLGSYTHGLNQGALLTAAVAIGVIGWVAHRRGGSTLVAWAMVVIGLFAWAVGPDVLRSAWNPWITVLPLFGVIALAWNAACGELWSYPVAVAGGSFVVESHVGYAGVTLAVLGGAALVVVVTAVRHTVTWRQVGVVGLVSIGVLGLLWSPPLYQEVRDTRGNLTELRQFFADAKPDHDVGDGVEVTMQELGVVPAQLGTLDTGDAQNDRPGTWTGAITLAALGAAVAIAALRRCTSALYLAGLVSLAILAAIWSVAHVVGAIDGYLVLWIAATGGAAWLALGAALLAPGTGRPVARPRLVVLLVPVALLSAVNVWSAWQAGPPETAATAGVEQLARAIRPALDPPSAGPVLVRVASAAAWPMAAGVMVDLERRGYTTVVDPDMGWLLGEQRERRPGSRVASTLTLADAQSAPGVNPRSKQLIASANALSGMSVFLQK
jgi:hypothetical protein